ncbi:MAG: sulfite exporter TauE/SafE family protein [Kangiellaceae bacterium]|nr:sulfite exporter TauE/SafE family protein [Kangiellaceae bacterium]
MNLSILAILGACAIGLSLGLLGSGGSILTVPVLVYLVDQPERIAIAGSLVIVGSIALLGAVPYFKQKLIDWNTVLMFGIPGMAGTYIGAWLATEYLTGIQQLAIFAVVMLLASYFMLRPKKDIEAESDHQRHTIKISLDGLIVGIVTGVVGVGGGFLIVPALVLLGGLTMRRAVATSLVIIALKSYTGFAKYWDAIANDPTIQLDWNVIAVMIVLGGLGSLVGNKIANKVPQDKLKKIFGIFLIVMGVYILIKSIPQLI